MDRHQISFAKIYVIRQDIAEIIVDTGADIDLKMVAEIHQYLLLLFSDSFSLLINKSNAYSTQLDALIQFGTLSAINKIAVFAPNRLAQMSADFSASIPSSANLNIQVFTDRDEALAWLV